MRKAHIQISVITLCLTLTLASCGTKNVTDNLPKDIAERPVDENSKKYDEVQLEKIKAIIVSEINKEKCTNADDWMAAPLGSKACGGPKSYIAYPKKLEAEILPEIEDYNKKESEFNTKYGITSDCSVIEEPQKIKCSNGKAELVYATK
ncbi:hypothetical protein IQ37_14030 [Chryseobacterium piperi]|uniref:Lipoprotein n=1 Tax=Chryseobacterium piperi TaxID=558152 RepID=A0A086B483_9FLAO|nr:hypothetical protein [Chryseobacterium piperi]ASW76007.1 hypothetical protein CJF12_18190 [Chryseobacterium piperi]KFF23747.1 hypothetical protein IQ37_14030 [Chryseobacterium piperi]